MTVAYELWRESYEDAESASRAAFDLARTRWQALQKVEAENVELRREIERLKEALDE